MYRAIKVKTQFEETHCWPAAPDEVAFLRNPHRHMFHVEAEIVVSHNDRELEYFMVRKVLDNMIAFMRIGWKGTESCEYIAEYLSGELMNEYRRAVSVSVFEDNENGSVVAITE